MQSFTPSELDILWLHDATDQNARLFSAITERLGSASEAREAAGNRSEAAFACLPSSVRARLFRLAAEDGFDQRVEAFIAAGIQAVFCGGAGYPPLLQEIYAPPAVLFIRGALRTEPSLPLAIIGSRNATQYGCEMAKLFGLGFAQRGATVISGMALGADACAARGALSCKDATHPTVAVLGSGVDVIYPLQNRALYQEIVERGAVVSEYWPGTPSRKEHFPARNRIISGLSRGVLVVEAAHRSGTSITAGFAHEQGRDVFAIPGRITDAQSVGTNRLIQQGAAKPCFCVEDVLCEYPELGEASTNADKRIVRLSEFSDAEREILWTLQREEADIDALCTMLPYSVGQINSALTGLLFSGVLCQMPGRVYALNVAECVYSTN